MAELPEGALMQRAAHGLAYAVLDLLGSAYGRRVLLLVGSGDNGGDALYAGAVLARRGVQVEAWVLSDSAHAQGVGALREPEAGSCPRACALSAPSGARPEVVVDGIVGIGGRPGLRPEAQQALRALGGIPIVAVDTPSGVDVDTGELDGPHVTAAVTVTFGTHKVAHLVDPAAAACGAIHLVDIGLELPQPRRSRRSSRPTSRGCCPAPRADAQKYTRGVVGIRAGSSAYPGAGAAQRGRRGDGAVRHGALRRRRRRRRPRAAGPPRGRRRRPGAGLGGRQRQRRRRGRPRSRRPSTTTSRSWSTPTP